MQKSKFSRIRSSLKAQLSRFFIKKKPMKPYKSLGNGQARLNIAVFSNGLLPLLQFSLIKPLEVEINSGICTLKFFNESQLAEANKQTLRETFDSLNENENWRPSHFFLSRYGGALASDLLDYAKEKKIETIYQIDDDLLNVPLDLGPEKYKFHSNPVRTSTIKFLLANCDKVFASTQVLGARLLEYCDIRNLIISNPFIPAFKILPAPSIQKAVRIGYMGFDHQKNLEYIAPALAKIFEQHPTVTFHLFGKMHSPPILEPFSHRIFEHKPVYDYQKYLESVYDLGWDIGLCPLTNEKFNSYKANTKWVEYSALGITVVASRGFAYDDVCLKGGGLLASNPEEWFDYLDLLIKDPQKRSTVLKRAQEILTADYSVEKYNRKLAELFDPALAGLHLS